MKGLLFLLLILPLLFFFPLLYPTVSPKAVFFIIGTDVLFFSLIIKGFPTIASRWKSVFVPLFMLQLGVWLISSLLGGDFITSFIGIPGRLEGWIIHFHLFLFFLIVLAIHDHLSWQKILRVSVFMSGVLALHSILLSFFPGPLSISPKVSGHSTFGNTFIASQYFLLHFFISLQLFLFSRPSQSEAKQLKRKYSRILLAMAGILNFVALFVLARRGILLALVVGLFVLAFRLKKLPLQKLTLWARRVIVGMLVMLLFGWFIVYQYRGSELVRKSPLLTQLTANVNTLQTRLWLIPVALKGFQEKPFFGFGLEQFEPVFMKYHDPKFLRYEADSVWNDRAHNFMLESLVNGGIFGTLLLIVIMGVIFAKTWRFPILFSAFLAYFIQAFFEPSSLIQFFFFFLLLGYAEHCSRQHKEEKITPLWLGQTKFLRPLAIAMSGVFSVLFSVGTALYLWSDLQMGRAMRNDFSNATVPIFLENFDKGYQMARFFPSLQKGYLYKATYELSEGKNRMEDKRAIFPLVAYFHRSLEDLTKRFPHDAKTFFYFIDHALTWYEADPQYLSAALLNMPKLEALAPNFSLLPTLRAEMYQIQNQPEKMIEELKSIVSRVPESAYAQWNLGRGYFSLARFEEAVTHFQRAVELNIRLASAEEIFIIADAAKKIGNYEFLRILYEKAVLQFSEHALLRQQLAAVYAREGNVLWAEAEARRAIQIDPELRASGEEFIRGLPKIFKDD